MKSSTQLLIALIYFFLFNTHILIAQEGNDFNPQFPESVDTSWVNHYTSGLLQGKAQFAAMTTDALGNVYATGMILNMSSSEDYITVKYNSAGVVQWTAIYNGPGNSYDAVNSIAVDELGNVYVTGGSNGVNTSRDFATIKYNANGEEQWVARYDGSGSEAGDSANDIVIDESGNIYVTGGSDSNTSGDYATIKYNSEGIEQWVARYNGPVSDGGDDAYYMAIDVLGNIYVTGRSDGPNANDDYATIKYNNDGVQKWVARYNGPASAQDIVAAIGVDEFGNVYVTGSSVNAQNRTDYATVKYDSAGIEQWNARYVGPGNSYDKATALVINDSGYVYVTGNSYDGVTKDDFTTIKYAPSGIVQWISRYNGSANGNDKATAIDIDSSGNIYVSGQSEGSAIVKYTPAGNEVWTANYQNIYMVVALSLDPSENIHIAGNSLYDCATIKFNNAGVEEWAITQSGPGLGFERPAKMVLDPMCNLFVAGRSRGVGTSLDYFLIKYDPAGVQQWDAIYNGPDNWSEMVTAIGIDSSGNIYLTGSSDVPGAGSDWATVKYNSDGVEQWVSRLNGIGNYHDGANALTIDKNGNVFVTGYSSSTTSLYSRDFTTVKYNASGIEQWVAYYDGPGQVIDQANAIALDNDGNVYITGYSPGLTSSDDFTTIKYNNDGIEQWVARYNGTGNSGDVATCIAVDFQQNIVVSGASIGDGSNFDYAAIQYNPEGVEQWVKRYNGNGNGWDWPEALAINDSSEIFITGYGEGSNGDNDFITIKYDRFGNEKWVSKYDGPSYDYDKAKAIAIGENGNVYVTGVSTGFYGSYDYATVKINSEGYREWVLRYDAGYDEPLDVVTDGLGHIYVTGYTMNNYDTYAVCTTIKYTDNSATDIESDTDALPDIFLLEQNYPNPFNPTTTIKYSIPEMSKVSLILFNLLGEEIITLVNDEKPSGNYKVNFNAANLSSGVYFYRIQAGSFVETRKMILLK